MGLAVFLPIPRALQESNYLLGGLGTDSGNGYMANHPEAFVRDIKEHVVHMGRKRDRLLY